MNRPCIDPLDPTCPKLAPNYFNECPAMNIFKQNLTSLGQSLDDILEAEEDESKDNFALDFFSAFLGGGGGSKSSSENSSDTLGGLFFLNII